MSEKIDLSFSPDTYFPESKTREELLSRIKGQSRREIARGILEREGIKGLNAFIAREELTDHDRDMWGRIHPWMMGGEYLPEFKREESSYQEVCLASFIRARRSGSAPTRVVGLSSFASKLIGHQHRGQFAVVFLEHGDTAPHLPGQLMDVPAFIELQCGVSVP